MAHSYCTCETDAYIWLIEGFGNNVMPAGCNSSPRATDQSWKARLRLDLNMARQGSERFHCFLDYYLSASEDGDMDAIVGGDE